MKSALDLKLPDGLDAAAHADLPELVPIEVSADETSMDLVGLLSSVQETAYLWDIASDRMEWERNAAEVLGFPPDAAISKGADFSFLIAPEHVKRRHEAILGVAAGEAGKGAPYRVQYRFAPGGRRSDNVLWLEDHGRCWFDDSGKPTRARGIVRVINERYWEEQRLLYRSDHDELTGQLNRIRLTEALGAVVTRAERTRQPCAFVMIAVNNLAVINESFGFDVGDEVIAAVARIIKGRLRGGDSVGRYSSNKFGVILNDCGPAAMRVAAERFMKGVREAPIRTAACQLSATVSVGGVLLPDQAATVHQALSHALQALDAARINRNDTFVAFEPSAVKETARLRNITVADQIISALDENRIKLMLQPIVNAVTGVPKSYECLLRMVKEDGTVVSAGEFISVAEQLGLSRLIDRRALELTVELLNRHPQLQLSVNVSSLTTSDHDWLLALHRLTGGRRQLTERLIVEITETAAIHDLDQTMNFVDTLKEFGCKVAIDDFGAGYTSFRNLKHLNVDHVKIDGSFVTGLKDDPTNRVFIKALVDIANAFGMETVAEWVADEEAAVTLRELGVTSFQGYLYGEPIEASQLRLVRS